MKVYAFLYNSFIHESAAQTTSLHMTEESANRAMEIHKEFTKHEHFKMIESEPELWPDGDDDWDWAKMWFVMEMEILD